MRMYDIIENKKVGKALTHEEIRFFVDGVTHGTIPDYQTSALLMAIYFQGMTDNETRDLTLAMAESGDMLDLSKIEGIIVDKHSTGGVGDKTSLVLAPMVAACGVPVAKMSGRGLGHTGGTIDKLESFEGFNTVISEDEFIDNVNKIKMAIVGQTANLAPADKKLYALRDVTATVNIVSLIASSIMSKKIASGANGIVLDVKMGSGAFMKTVEDAKILANEMVSIGNGLGRETIAVISDMDQPLGFAIGNALEVKEAIASLKGEGPKDLMELCYVLGAQMLVIAKKASDTDEARKMLEDVIASGSALEVFKTFIVAQGGQLEQVMDVSLLPQALHVEAVCSKQEGYVATINSEEIGLATMLLGGGRETKEDVIDLSVGYILNKKLGDYVAVGDTLAYVHYNDTEKMNRSIERFIEAYGFLDEPVKISPFIYGVVSAETSKS